ncbi:2'-5' RNA ligase family protein [Gracilimonas mengyeensis]|uniref:2'-5' RNA ligase n=1 Tax=Gracilimonas mengyeensis TaxID=1302730 RepID=A0A521DIS8_9BACT|nr:2'-5' RNA ligase family protein [Gracilimonas mengyeensis]SMO71492.1 2'-5' RNA ligase [Gracilimonas mengyeensis]
MKSTPASKQISLFHTSDMLSQYLVLISLPEEITNDVVSMKELFREEFGSFPSEHSVPHITVCSFLLMNNRSSEVFSLFQQSLQDIAPFQLAIDGFNYFENGVIYLQIKLSESFTEVSQQLNLCRKHLRIRKNYISSSVPHITIARGLPKQTLRQAKELWMPRSYYNTFEVNELTVLSYDFEENRYRKHSTLSLKPD